MWQSPITMITENIVNDITKKTDGTLVEYVRKVGFDVDRDELTKALAYDRGQYEKGYADGRADRDAEIVRCRDCAKRDGDYCHRFNDGYSAFIHCDDFCNYAERRDEDV